MGRPKRPDEAGCLYHALNRGNARVAIFRKPADFDSFEGILAEGVQRYPCQILAYQLMPTHWHFVLRPTEDGGMSNFLRWVSLTHTMRFHSHYRSVGTGHIYQGRFKSFPIQNDEHFLAVCRYVERNALRAGLVPQAENWAWGSLSRWLANSEMDPTLLAPWPISRSSDWQSKVNAALSAAELTAIRRCVNRGSPFGDEKWTATTTDRFGLESTLTPRGRPKKES